MLTQVKIRNYQSLRDVDLGLEKLTVIVGASSSGKSALLRALRTLAFNSPGSSFVSGGMKVADVEVLVDDQIVALERGPAHSVYRIRPIDRPYDEVYPKAGATVPQDVRSILRLAEVEGEPLSFAFQFDRPFLLDAPGTQVAKVLGDLTNINVLHDAVREANRRRLNLGSTLKVRRADLEEVREKVKAFTGIPAQREKLASQWELLTEATATQETVTRLTGLIFDHGLATSALESLKPLKGFEADLEDVQHEAGQVDRLGKLLALRDAASKALSKAESDLETQDGRIAELEQSFHDQLKEAGVCPLCGQEVS